MGLVLEESILGEPGDDAWQGSTAQPLARYSGN